MADGGEEEGVAEPIPTTVSVPENKLIVSELLCYLQYHMRRSVCTNIVEVIARHFSMDEISSAREILLSSYGEMVGFLLKNRRTTPGRNKCLTVSEDLMLAMKELDTKGIETNFVAKNLSRLPKCDPKDIDPYATMQMLLALDDRLKVVEDSLSDSKVQILSQDENLKTLKELVKTHEVILTNQLLPF